MNKLNKWVLKIGHAKQSAIGITLGFWFSISINPTPLSWGLALGSTAICIVMFIFN